MALGGCRSHQSAVVNAKSEFVATEVWTLVELRGKEVSRGRGEVVLTFQVNPEAGTFRGNSGCNRYFGNFKDLGEGKMLLDDFNATKTACPDAVMKKEGTYMQLLRRCDNYIIGNYSLELRQGDKTLLKFEKQVD